MLIIIILEVPVELAELLGENAPGLPEGLAIYLASDGREGDILLNKRRDCNYQIVLLE